MGATLRRLSTYGEGLAAMGTTHTIFAPAAMAGAGNAIVPIRISGPGAKLAATALLSPESELRPRLATRKAVIDPKSGSQLDDAIAIMFPGPRSYTGEDMLELHLHGGRSVVSGVLRSLESLEGFRVAGAGEFTRRAFENGRMDLTEAEAVADLLNADTDVQREQALRQLRGGLKKLYESWAADLRKLLAFSEAVIDMGDDEEDVEDDSVWRSCAEGAAAIAAELQRHLDDGKRGELVRSGLTVALVGPPNAGKSSLLNALAGSELAIVSDTPGTTRDAISTRLDVGGVPVDIVDTAGLRDATDAVEAEGVRRALQRAEHANAVVLVCDAAQAVRQAEGSAESGSAAAAAVLAVAEATAARLVDPGAGTLSPSSASAPTSSTSSSSSSASSSSLAALASECLVVIAANKWDEVQRQCSAGGGGRLDAGEIASLLAEMAASRGAVAVPTICATPDEGQAERESGGVMPLAAALGDAVARLCFSDGDATPALTRERHRAHLEECLRALLEFGRVVRGGDGLLTADIASEELRLAVGAMARITGRVDVEQVLDDVFRHFCVGK